MTLSNEQNIILEEYVGSNNNILVNASAGAGKTFMILELLKYTDSMDQCLYLVFNKRNQEEMVEKVIDAGLSENVAVATMHSLGMKIITYNMGNVQVNNNKQFELLFKTFDAEIKDEPKEGWRKLFKYDKAVSLVRTAVLTPSLKNVENYLQYHTVEPMTKEELRLVISFVKKLRKKSKVIDFANMIEFPAIHELKVPKYDVLAIDEFQDTSELLIKTLEKISAKRYVFVGDQKQSCYLFAGAHPYISETINKTFSPTLLPLTTTYRCDVEICEQANGIYPKTTNPRADAEQGQIVDNANLSYVEEGDFVLSRTTAPLLEAYFELIEGGVACTVVGKEIENDIKSYMKQLKRDDRYDESVPNMLAILEDKIQYDTDKAKSNAEKDRLKNLKEAISVLSMGCSYVPEMLIKLDSIYDIPEGEYVRLMTIHRSKGLEADNVYIIRSYNNKTLFPYSREEQTEQEILQEQNLTYIAVTRPRHSLGFIDLKNEE